MDQLTKAGSLLAQLDDWRAILWSLIILVFILLLFASTIAIIVIRKQSMALTVALQATKDSTAALLENAKSETALASGLTVQAAMMARIEPLLIAGAERTNRTDALLRRVENALEQAHRDREGGRQ